MLYLADDALVAIGNAVGFGLFDTSGNNPQDCQIIHPMQLTGTAKITSKFRCPV